MKIREGGWRTSARDNFHSMMEGSGAERLPFFIKLTPPVEDRMRKELGSQDAVDRLSPDFRILHADFSESPEAWEAAYAELGITLPPRHAIGRVGITQAYPENRGTAYHLSQLVHTLSEIDDLPALQSLPWPDANDPAHYRDIAANIQSIKDQGQVSVFSQQCTIFEDAWYLRGMDNLMLDLIEENAVGSWLLDYLTERSVATVRAYAKAGVDAIWLGDDIGMQDGMLMSPEFWRTHFKPRLARVIEAARANARGRLYLIYHSDGNIEPIIEDLLQMGIDILNPMQPECMNVEAIIRKYQDRAAFWGMVGTQSVLPFGSPADCRQVVEDLCRLAREGARIICSPTHVVEPDVATENILALVQAERSLEGERIA